MISDVYVRLNRYLLDLSISATREKKRRTTLACKRLISSRGRARESLSPPTDDDLDDLLCREGTILEDLHVTGFTLTVLSRRIVPLVFALAWRRKRDEEKRNRESNANLTYLTIVRSTCFSGPLLFLT